MMKVKAIKIVGIFLIFALTANTTVLAAAARYSRMTRLKINSVSNNKGPSKTILPKDKNVSTHREKKLIPPDEVITITNPVLVSISCIGAVSIQSSCSSSNSDSDIFIPPRISL